LLFHLLRKKKNLREKRATFPENVIAAKGLAKSSIWLLTPVEVCVEYYFENALGNSRYGQHNNLEHLLYLLSRHPEDPRRQHLIRFYDWWNNATNSGALDELSGIHLDPFFYQILPENIQGTEEVILPPESIWTDDNCELNNFNPSQLLRLMRGREKKLARGNDTHFHFLDGLKDKGNLKVLRSRDSILKIGEELKNCAAMYRDRVEKKQCALVSLHSITGKAIALGQYNIPGGKRWVQIRESCNQLPSHEVKSEFESYLPTIASWEGSWKC